MIVPVMAISKLVLTHSRPQSPSFLGHVVRIKPRGSGDENGVDPTNLL